MAGVVKGVQQVVSSGPTQCDAFSTDSAVDNFSFSADVNNKDLLTLNPPTSDDLSLQDLIDSELALRISSSAAEDAAAVVTSNGVAVDNGDMLEEVADEDMAVVNGSLITDFLDHERSHTESASLSSTAAAPLCSADSDILADPLDDLMGSELGSEPADSDFSPNIPCMPSDDADPEDPLADEATLAEDLSMASDRSQERSGSLLDLDPLRPDTPGPPTGPGPGHGPGHGPGEPREQEPAQLVAGEGEGLRGELLEAPVAAAEPCSEESVRAGAERGPEKAEPEPSAAAQQEQQEQEAAIADPTPAAALPHDRGQDHQDDAEGLLVSLEPEPPAECVANPVQPEPCVNGVNNNSMEMFPRAVPPAEPAQPAANPASFDDGFETWSTVEEAVAQSELLADGVAQEKSSPVHEGLNPNSDSESVSETSEKRTSSKKKKIEGNESTTTKKKTKKSKKSEEKENISVKSSFSKFDQLSKKTVLHVRSVDAAKVQKQFNESASSSPEAQTNCKACSKQVFVMEQIKAEKSVWHKNCFRCKECSKQLTVDTYSSNEGDIYCKPHFRELFKPKAVVEDSPDPASDKPDLGLEELSSLNVKSRFQVFEKTEDNKSSEVEKSPSTVNVKRSPSILSKLAKFQAKGMDIGVTDESLNGIPYEESSTSSEEEEDDGEGDEENGDIVKSRRATRERPMSFSKMEDVKSRWETGSTAKKEERREERKQEIQSIRSRLFMGKQGKMKEMYEQAVKESEQPAARRGAEVRSEKAKSIKEKFERGETLMSDEDGEEHDNKKIKDEDIGVFEAGISKKSRSLFLELDASAAKTAQQAAPSRPSAPKESKKSEMESPEREVYRDPDVVRSDDQHDGDELQHSMTTSKMLSIFRQMEEKAQRDDVPDGPKPLKCFTPPPDYKPESGSSEEERSSDEDEEEDEEEDDDGVIRSSVKAEDEFLKAAKEAAKAKTLRAKFEHWEEQENNINTGGGNINSTLLESEHESIESTKSLRARFESLKNEAEAPKEKPRPKVNRFVEIQTSCAEFCDSCEKKVYPLEKVETGGKLFHKGCFRCMQCSCILRMESYTLNNGKLYCIPHFKQLFISKGNYDEGFGLDQHKRKWNSSLRENGDILLSGIDANGNSH